MRRVALSAAVFLGSASASVAFAYIGAEMLEKTWQVTANAVGFERILPRFGGFIASVELIGVAAGLLVLSVWKPMKMLDEKTDDEKDKNKELNRYATSPKTHVEEIRKEAEIGKEEETDRKKKLDEIAALIAKMKQEKKSAFQVDVSLEEQ